MIPNESLEIFRSSHWIARHSVETAIPGYIVLSSTHHVTTLGDLPSAGSEELGPLLRYIAQAVGKCRQAGTGLYVSVQRDVFFGSFPHFPTDELDEEILPRHRSSSAISLMAGLFSRPRAGRELRLRQSGRLNPKSRKRRWRFASSSPKPCSPTRPLGYNRAYPWTSTN